MPGSCGSPSTCSATVFSWISVVPAPMVEARVRRKPTSQRPVRACRRPARRARRRWGDSTSRCYARRAADARLERPRRARRPGGARDRSARPRRRPSSRTPRPPRAAPSPGATSGHELDVAARRLRARRLVGARRRARPPCARSTRPRATASGWRRCARSRRHRRAARSFEAALAELVATLAPDLAARPPWPPPSELHRRASPRTPRPPSATRSPRPSPTRSRPRRGSARSPPRPRTSSPRCAPPPARATMRRCPARAAPSRAEQLRAELARLDADLARAGGAPADEVAAAVADSTPTRFPRARRARGRGRPPPRRARRPLRLLTLARDELARLERSEEAARRGRRRPTLEAQIRPSPSATPAPVSPSASCATRSTASAPRTRARCCRARTSSSPR